VVGLDTNVLVRYLAQDDAMQSARATRLIERELSEREPGFIGLVVLVECCWVLKRLYGATGEEVRGTVRDLLETRQFVIEQRTVVLRALARVAPGGNDLAHALIAEAAAQAGCSRTLTFDKQAARMGMELLSR
jgi:predicted nucleic-acid-binding protein